MRNHMMSSGVQGGTPSCVRLGRGRQKPLPLPIVESEVDWSVQTSSSVGSCVRRICKLLCEDMSPFLA